MRFVAMLAAAAIGLTSPASSHGQAASAPSSSTSSVAATAAGDHAAHQLVPPPGTLPPNVPPITEADRTAAFPDVEGHKVHDTALNYFILFDQVESRSGGGWNLDNKGWIGGDLNRFWFRTEGESGSRAPESAQAHLLYGRAISRWWDVVAGMRQDFRPGAAQTWGAVGLQGLAPYWFDVEATAYVGGAGRTHFRLEAEYELLLTNRIILQPLIEAEVYGKRDLTRQLGRGLSSAEAGLRLRYEIRREFAPYFGIVWNQKFFATADYAAAAGQNAGGAQLVFGIRLWR